MERQVVRPGEGPLAELALERLLARVLPEVARQLVGPGELPRAALPRAALGLLWLGGPTCVRPLMRLEVGALGVHLLAALEVALVDLAPPQGLRVGRGARWGRGRRASGRRGSVGAGLRRRRRHRGRLQLL
ncbi:unnamed protein product, partial [Ixodes pacificus]